MSRPVGSKNKPKAIKNDSYANALAGTGSRRDRSIHTQKTIPFLIDQVTAMSLFIGDGMARRIISVPVEEMTRAGFELEDMDEGMEKTVLARCEELDLMKHLNDCLTWSGVFGGSLLIMGLNDGGTLDTPLNEDGIKSVEFLRPVDRWQATIQTRVSDPMNPQYGQPETWLISPHTGGTPYIVHHSRVHMFDGDAVPDLIRQQNQGWGASRYQSCLDQLTRLGTSHQWANSLLERAQQAVHKIPGLSNILRAPGGESLVQQRVDVVDMVRSILNTIVIDGEEGYDVINNTFSGVTDLLDRFAEALSAVSGIPVFLLMGKSQGGLSDSNAGNLEGWYARIEAMQNDVLRRPIDRIVGYIAGPNAGEYKIKFCPLYVPSEKEKAETEKLEAEAERIDAETAQIYVNMGALDPSEVRKEISEDYEIDPATMPEPPAIDDEALINGGI